MHCNISSTNLTSNNYTWHFNFKCQLQKVENSNELNELNKLAKGEWYLKIKMLSVDKIEILKNYKNVKSIKTTLNQIVMKKTV